MKRMLVGIAALALGGCSSFGTLFGPGAQVKVAEVGNAQQCATLIGNEVYGQAGKRLARVLQP
ncbi:MAG: hypothetical protein QM661_10390 [Solimonas sp.]